MFEYDWDHGMDYKVQHIYNCSAMAYITNKDKLPVNIPSPPSIPNAYVTSLTTYSASIRNAYTAPDFALKTVSSVLSSTQSALYLMIYQVMDNQLCSDLLNMYNKGIDVKLLVSDRIFDNTDWKSAQVSHASYTLV